MPPAKWIKCENTQLVCVFDYEAMCEYVRYKAHVTNDGSPYESYTQTVFPCTEPVMIMST